MWQLMHAVLGLPANLLVWGSSWIYCSHHSSSLIFFKSRLSAHAAPWLKLRLEVVRDRHGFWFVFTISSCLIHPHGLQFVFTLVHIQLISNHQSGWPVITLGSELDAEATRDRHWQAKTSPSAPKIVSGLCQLINPFLYHTGYSCLLISWLIHHERCLY